jgi:prevent-host-death family protein
VLKYEKGDDRMNLIRPVSDLRNNFADISKTVHETDQPVFLTKNGYGDMVVLSMEAYENLQFDSEVYAKLQAAQREAQLTAERFSSKDVLKAAKAAIRGDDGVSG